MKKEAPKHICKGCGSCYAMEKKLENLLKDAIKHPERFQEGVYIRNNASDEKESYV